MISSLKEDLDLDDLRRVTSLVLHLVVNNSRFSLFCTKFFGVFFFSGRNQSIYCSLGGHLNLLSCLRQVTSYIEENEEYDSAITILNSAICALGRGNGIF